MGLGLLLRAQSKGKWLVRHYLKHYHYPNEAGNEADEGVGREGVVKRATEEAFRNWQVVYNISLVMTYGKESPEMVWNLRSTESQCPLLVLLGKRTTCPVTGQSVARFCAMSLERSVVTGNRD